MRRTIINTGRQATRILETERAAHRTAYVCANCRAAAAARTPSSTPILGRRALSTSVRHQQRESMNASSSSQQEAPIPQTHYEFFPQTFPQGPPPKSHFSPDLKQLRKEFLQLQAKAHPDLARADQKRQAEALSMRINEAYKVLQDPLKRAQYLLSLQGIDVEDESLKLSGGPLLMEVMEAREAVDEVEGEEELLELRAQNDLRIADSVRILDAAFEKGDADGAAQEAVRLRYWKNIEESIHGWEKGQGGGVIHH